MSNTAKLTDGSEWADHEDCIVGNEEGLRNLIKACEKAIEGGQYYGNELGDYVGVKRLDDAWFENPKDKPSTRLGNFMAGVIVIGLVGLLLVGVTTVFSWVF